MATNDRQDMPGAVETTVTAPAPTPGPQPETARGAAGAARHPGAVLVIVLVSYLMIVLDISIVITALPRMRDTLGLSTTGLSWVQNSYTLAFGGLLLLGARAGDILGRRRMFRYGLALFTIASLAVGATQNPTWLIIARAVQGIGAAILAPSTLALLTVSFPEGRERTRAVAYYGAVAGIGASIGLLLGGVLTDLISWRVGFFINLPVGVAMIVAAPRYLPETARVGGRFDLTGALTSTVGMTALVYGIVRSVDIGWTHPITITALAAGAVLLDNRRASEASPPDRATARCPRQIRACAHGRGAVLLCGFAGVSLEEFVDGLADEA